MTIGDPAELIPAGNLVKNGSFEDPVITSSHHWNVLAPGQLPEWTILSTRSTIKAEIQEIGISSWRPPKGKGSQWLELDGDENGPGKKWDATAMGRAEEGLYAIRQTLVVEPGKPYALMFDFAARPGTKQNENEMKFSVLGMDDKPLKHAGGDDVAGVILAAPHQIVAKSTPPVWQTATEIFVAPASGQVKIEFEGLGPNNTYGMFLDNVVVVPLAKIDVDVDSDNSGYVEGSALEDAIEDIEGVDATPGLYLQVQDEDTDGDGIVNWADGFDGLGDGVSEDDVSLGASFAPLWVRIPDWAYAPDATLEITYSASAPSALVMDPHYLTWDRPSDGHLRIWTKDASVTRSRDPVQEGGDYVAPTSEASRSYTLAELGLVAGDNKLFLEAIRESTSTAQQKIDFRLTPRIGGNPASFVLEDTVRVTTARIEVMADNRDGTAPFPTFGLTATRMPDPNAGLSGLVPEFSQAYTINIYDPRGPETIHTVYVADTPLALAPAGTARYTTPVQFLPVPEEDLPLVDADEAVDGLLGGPLRPSDVIGDAIVVPVSGPTVEIRYNGKATLSKITSAMMEEADALFTEVGSEVAKSMEDFDPLNANGKNIAGNFDGPGTYNPRNPGALGIEFEARLHRRFSELAAQGNALAGQFLSGIVVDRTNGNVVAQAVEDTTQVDVLFVKKGYVPEVGKRLDTTKVLVFEVKTSAAGDVPRDQLNRLKTLTGQPVRSIHSPLKYIADGTGSFKVAQNTKFRAFVNMLSAFGKRLPQAAQGALAVGIGLRAMSAEAVVAEEQLTGALEANINKFRETSQDHERKFIMNDGWNIIKEIMRNRGIELDNHSQAMVMRSIYLARP